MTYKDKIDQINGRIAKLYFEVEFMRDCAPEGDKSYWEKLRKNLFDADYPLSELKSTLSTHKAEIDINRLIK